MTGQCPFCAISLPYGYFGECPNCKREVYIELKIPEYSDSVISGTVTCYVHETLDNVKDMLLSYVSHNPEFGLYYERITETLDTALDEAKELEEKLDSTENLDEYKKNIDLLEELVSQGEDESKYQIFFEGNPNFFSLKLLSAHPKPNFGGELEPDFLLKHSDGRHIIVEIETPSVQLYTKRGRIRPTSTFTNAEKQLQDQLRWAKDNIEWLQNKHRFPAINSDNIYGLLVIGEECALSAEAKRSFENLRSHARSQYEIKTFDEIVNENIKILENIRARAII